MTIAQLAAQAAAALYQYGGTSKTEAQLAEIIAAALTDLGAGNDMVFFDVASLNTSPGRITSPGFYVAVDEGTYNGLGKHDVDAGDIAIIYNEAVDPLVWNIYTAYSGQTEQYDQRYIKQTNIATSLAGTPLDSQVPSAKLLKDTIVTSVSDASTDLQVPSAKCLYTMLGNVEALLAEI